jgi:hypothetical protein
MLCHPTFPDKVVISACQCRLLNFSCACNARNASNSGFQNFVRYRHTIGTGVAYTRCEAARTQVKVAAN